MLAWFRPRLFRVNRAEIFLSKRKKKHAWMEIDDFEPHRTVFKVSDLAMNILNLCLFVYRVCITLCARTFDHVCAGPGNFACALQNRQAD